ncbi:MAG: dehydrogenase E1 component subunit alpha/beta [Kiritimatiellae bacterium]|nr:dehydrogenase E1 component subunit alpha/beta [Kiritimatiellia bacterium]
MERLEAYTRMLTIRLFEEAVERLFLEGRIMGTAHTCIGQEAVAVGVAAALGPQDAMTSTHRGHGHLIARGGEPGRVMAELFGRETGYSHGRGGSQMMIVPELGFYGANGITAGSTAFAAGLALEAKLHGTGRAVVCILGDGASNQGIFYESLNLAALWKLPVVYLIENNGYAMSTATERGLADTAVADRAKAFNLPGRQVDGNDPFAVRDALRLCLERARSGEGPCILECLTYRLSGHSRGDPRVYRSREEESAAWKRDPVTRICEGLTEKQIAEGRTAAEKAIADAVTFAESSPAPRPADPDALLFAPVVPASREEASPTAAALPASESGQPATFTQTLRETLDSVLTSRPEVFVMGEDIGVYGGSFGVTRGLFEKYGAERIRDTPISEQALTGCAIGAAVAGLRPVIEFMFMDFMTLAVDQLVNFAAKLHAVYGLNCPLVARTATGAGRGYGATHSQTLERIFFGVPGIKIAAPSNPGDAASLLREAIRDNNPVLFIEHKLLYPMRFPLENGAQPLPFGKARVAVEGSDATLVAWSYMVVQAKRAAEQLKSEGISVEVIDLRTLAPLDTATAIESAKKTGRVLIIEEGPRTGGVGAEIAARIAEGAFEYLEKPVRRIASPDLPVPAAKSLEALCVPTPESIAATVREMMS